MSEPIHVWCQCVRFERWYTATAIEPDIVVCECGHPEREHMDNIGPCTGESIVYNGRRADTMILSKIGLVTRLPNPLVWRPIRWGANPEPERTPVAHTLWNIRTPYPTAILCRCGRVLYRFGTELRHRDGTRCAEPQTAKAA